MASRRTRTPGLSAFTTRSSLSSQYATHGAALRNTHLDSLKTQLSVFQSLLHNFALQHSETIKQNPTFRAEFARMCNALGVDPLAASNAAGNKVGKGNWLGGLGGLLGRKGGEGEFGVQVALRVVEVCRATRESNGGLIGVEECRERVARGRGIGGAMEVSSDDILKGVESLKPLGGGFSIITVGSKQMIRSIPRELSTDQSKVLEAIQVLGYVSVSMLEQNLGWENARAETVVEDLLAASLLWVDAKAPEKEYWSPAYLHDFDD